MSSTNRGGERTPLDAYYTPDAVALACVATIRESVYGAVVLEPHAGGGAFVRALDAAGAGIVYATDINGNAPGLLEPASSLGALDFLTVAGVPRFAWIVGNPPYDRAQEHVERALSLATDGAAFLLRLAFLESTKRLPFWRVNPPAEVYVLSRRPSFTGGGTDSAAYGWFIWRKGWTSEPVLRWLDWSVS